MVPGIRGVWHTKEYPVGTLVVMIKIGCDIIADMENCVNAMVDGATLHTASERQAEKDRWYEQRKFALRRL